MSPSPKKKPRRERPNRLIQETSPYLLQHAFNPVDWYPWGEEAIARSREENKPIFLSVGYSACHWCHVMEHESFEDDAIAALMNEHFVNIKVDREERPDLDQIYMSAVQLLTRRGGWPMSVFLTPDLKPFYGGTYFPPTSQRGMPGFKLVLQRVHEAWVSQQTEVQRGADDLTTAIQNMGAMEFEASVLDESILRRAMHRLVSSTDRQYGGFGDAPKFPHAMDLRVMLRCWKRFGDADTLECARFTLDRMARGGIYDHLGGGFHRYSTDERWLVPHFEKMLYDNALLVPAYLEAFQITGDAEFATVARETLDYVLREMTQPEGGFYSTQDADSEGEEGKFFVWYDAEIEKVLGEDDAYVFNKYYDIRPEGNWEGHSILNRVKPHADAARILDISAEELTRRLSDARAKLFERRGKRVAPGRDDKLIVAWNGMMLSAFAAGANILGDQRYADVLRHTCDFLLSTLRQPDGRLWHCYKDGRARFSGFLDDYACLIDGLIEAACTLSVNRYLAAAVELAEVMMAEFSDAQAGGFFYTPTNHESLIARNKEYHDGSTPSGNNMAVYALLKLAAATGRRDFESAGVRGLEYLSGLLHESPMACGQALLALDLYLGPMRTFVLCEGNEPGENSAAVRAVHHPFLPNKLVHRASTLAGDTPSAWDASLVTGRTASEGQPTLYVCEHGSCGLPVVGLVAIQSYLRTL